MIYGLEASNMHLHRWKIEYFSNFKLNLINPAPLWVLHECCHYSFVGCDMFLILARVKAIHKSIDYITVIAKLVCLPAFTITTMYLYLTRI